MLRKAISCSSVWEGCMPRWSAFGQSEAGWSLLALHSAATPGACWPCLKVGLLRLWMVPRLAEQLGSRLTVYTVLN